MTALSPGPPAGSGASSPLDDVHRGQLRMAYRLAAVYEGRILHVDQIGWHVWDGHRWARDREGHVLRAVANVLRAAHNEAFDLEKDARDALLADVRRCESAAGAQGVLTWAASRPQIAATVETLDQDPWLLNTRSGTLDLRTGEIRPPDPADRITKVTGCGYDPEAAAGTFDRFLAEAIPDPDVRAFLARLVGLGLVGKVIEHVLPIFSGAGRNGKGTFIRALAAAVGDYSIEAEPDLFLTRDRAHPTGQLDLRGTRLATCQETDAGRSLAVGTVKRLTGGDTIRARAMHKDFVEFRPSHLPILVTNHLPQVPPRDEALWARLLVVPWTVSFRGREDTTLDERLLLELPGILAWAVRGLADYQAVRLDPPDAVKVATDSYRVNSDDLARFVEEQCIEGAHYHVGKADLWAAWSDWCRSTRAEPGTLTLFVRALEERGYRAGATRGVKLWRGIGLLAAGPDDPDDD